MQLKELIRRKRDGATLERDEIFALVKGVVSGELKDYQASAWLMAVYFHGLKDSEMTALTEAMWKSGITLERDKSKTEFWIDKHSTGGVGDKTSLILVPIVSVVCEKLLGKGTVKIPMVSGRGLGHTGGTLDKLESVPGFRTGISIEEAERLLRSNGFFMMGQTADMAPADRMLYALRDATSTVESLPLIVSSIMSKKLSENLDGLVFDVKIGHGAFLQKASETRKLARTLVRVAGEMNVDGVAVLTSMDEPLGTKAGHHLEVEEIYDFAEGRVKDRGMNEVTLALASWMVHLSSRRSISLKQAENACAEMVGSEKLVRTLEEMFTAQGGDWKKFLANRAKGRTGCMGFDVTAPQAGYLSHVATRRCGFLISSIGGGRSTKEMSIDPDVGIEFLKKVGDRVERGEPVARVWHRGADKHLLEGFRQEAFKYSKHKVRPTQWVVEVINDERSAKAKRK